MTVQQVGLRFVRDNFGQQFDVDDKRLPTQVEDAKGKLYAHATTALLCLQCAAS